VSKRNIELIRSLVGAFNRGDEEGWLACYAEDVEVTDLNPALDTPGEMRGRAELGRYFATYHELFEDFRVEVEGVVDLGDHVVAELHWRGSGRKSGAAVEHRSAEADRLRDGLIERSIMGFADRESAIAAVRDGRV
jgi:uncharacterized protein